MSRRACRAAALTLLVLAAGCATTRPVPGRCPPGEHRVDDPGEPVGTAPRCKP